MRTILKSKSLILFTTAQLVGALVLLWPLLLPVYFVSIFVLLFFLILDFIVLPTRKYFQASGKCPVSVELNQEFVVEYEVSFSQIGRGRLGNLVLREFSHPSLSVSPAKLLKIEEIENERIVYFFSQRFKATRVGEIKIDQIILEVLSPNRFLARVIELDINGISLAITPPKAVVPSALFHTLVRSQKILRQGIHSIRKSRAAEQFHSLRDYRYPDPIRHIDYKKSAKFGSLMTKTFESLHSHHLVICLDLGRPMFGQIGQSRKLDYYLSACMHISQFALSHGDQVSFLAFSQSPHVVLPRTNKKKDIWKAISDPKISNPFEEESDYNLITKALPIYSMSRSIVLLLTDVSHPYVQNSVYSVMKGLSQKHVVMTLSLLEKEYEINYKVSGFKNDELSEEGIAEFLYSYWLGDQIESFTKKIDHFGAGALVIPDEYWLSCTEKVYSRLRDSGRV